MDRIRTSWRAHPDRWITIGLVLLVVAVAAPYAVFGPGFFREDWWQLVRTNSCLPERCPDPETSYRTVMVLLYDAGFALLGNNAYAWYAALTVLNASIAGVLYAVLRRIWVRSTAATVVLVWIVLPNHASLSYWPSAVHATVALLLALLGIRALQARRMPFAFVALAVAAASYEAFLLLALIAWVGFGPRSVRRRLLGAGALMVVPTHIALHQATHRTATWITPTEFLGREFAFGRREPFFVIFGLTLLSLTLFATYRSVRAAFRRQPRTPTDTLLFAGWGVVLVGVLPFLSSDYDTMFLGLGDRANVIAAIGFAVIWAAVAQSLGRRKGFVLLALVVVFSSIARVDADRGRAELTPIIKTDVAALRACASQHATTRVAVVVARDSRFDRANTYRENEARFALQYADPTLRVVGSEDANAVRCRLGPN